ncbi:class I SAM-dependent methyltransferase [Microlunatus speluncae]|uniref:class I SAM-dependent methyltransferase n=1 Tax=Microlunatus speluncae TaxID=2594267 RepID=UPI0012661094|nr:methyltransferase [Microlunatus speluncae]
MADQVSRVIMAEADRIGIDPGTVVVIDDQDGSLLLAAAERWPEAELRLHCDALDEEQTCRAAADRAGLRVTAADDLGLATTGAGLALARLPKGLDALELLAGAVARASDPEVVLIAGGRVKHLNRSMNGVLERHFGEVRGSLGLGKARALVGARARPGPEPQPRRAAVDGLEVVAYGGVFAGASLDAGTRLLLAQAPRFPAAESAIDLGCGTGLLAVALARLDAATKITAIDHSRAAVRSAVATAAANGAADRIDVRRGDGLVEVADESVDLIVCNPPFHRGTAKDSSTALTMITDAGRVLRPGGELWLVYNTHLPYRSALRRSVGPTEVITQDRDYLVTRSVKANP